MKTLFRNSQQLYTTLFLFSSVVAAFFYMRPLNSPWNPYIAGDGLGYYSYLPAKYIYHDTNFEFKWFNQVYDKNYVYDAFAIPEDNILVKYGDRKINKYYQGLSYVWTPFFFCAHVCAKFFGYATDGYSLPYQFFIGLASLIYLLLGLLCLIRLLQQLFDNTFAAVLATATIFFGTHLFEYAIFCNSLSHSYSFSFICMFLYFLNSFFQNKNFDVRNFLLSILCLIIVVFIRPLNVLIILIIPAFIPNGFFKRKFNFLKLHVFDYAILALIFGAVIFQFSIIYKQTGTFFPYTYSNESFHFLRAKFFDALFSYHMGIFLYVPAVFLALIGSVFLTSRQKFILPIFFFMMLYIYSAWWFYPITKRAMIDFYSIPAILLTAFFSRYSSKKAIIVTLSLLCIFLYQLKYYQVRSGILSENSTYGEIFWRNFFRIKKANQFPVLPESILKKEIIETDFENETQKSITNEKSHSGKYALLLDSHDYIPTVIDCKYPYLFREIGWKKIRFSFQLNCEPDVNKVHVFIIFKDKNLKTIEEFPFYIEGDYLSPNSWDYKEVGMEIADTIKLNSNTVNKITFVIWNVDAAKSKVYIDDAKVEFLLTDRSFETIKIE